MNLENSVKVLQRDVNEIKKTIDCLMTKTGSIITGGCDGFLEIANTFSSISDSTKKRMVYVLTDETNYNDLSLYLYTGTQLKFLQTVA